MNQDLHFGMEDICNIDLELPISPKILQTTSHLASKMCNTGFEPRTYTSKGPDTIE